MLVRMFADDAQLASATSRPVARGIALLVEPPDGSVPTEDGIRVLIDSLLPGWRVRAIQGLDGWFELTPPPDAQPLPLGPFWDTVRTLRSLPAVTDVDPLFLVANPQPDGEVETEAFALGFGREQFGLWGMPYDPELIRRVQAACAPSNWHLAQLRVPGAWALWQEKHPGQVPGAGIVVGHPDTGFSDHIELKDRFILPGRSFLLDPNGEPEQEARDELTLLRPGFLQNPGHGTSTASVIASGEHDATETGQTEAYGVAPGARILPLRVSRSVVHMDFGNVGNAILHATDAGTDVISMSLGGPVYSSFLRACIGRAQAQGIIVVSAAGNNVPTVVFPAAFPEVVAVAATHAAAGPWRFTGLGTTVDIAAPGEDVWCARASLTERGYAYSVGQGTGTSFATAGVAGLAALWLSHWGGRQGVADQYGGRLDLVPFVFQYLLASTANRDHDFVPEGKYGAGIADAQALLAAELPSLGTIERFALVIRAQPVTIFSTVSGLFSGLFGLVERPAVALTAEDADAVNGRTPPQPPEQTAVVLRAEKDRREARERLGQVLGEQTDDLAPELLARIAADRLLLVGFQRWRHGQALLPFLDRMLAPPADQPADATLSDALKQQLAERREREEQRLAQIHRGRLVPGVSLILPPPAPADSPVPTEPPTPGSRRLRAYAFDPSLATKLDTARIHQVTIPTRWEHVLPGPVGEYLEVVDIDPSSGCAYSPVDLNHPHVLGQDGLAPSEGSPQFHQQMVYAVAMNTIERFELALGRPIFWSPLRPWLRERPDERSQYTTESLIPIGLAPTDPMVPEQVARRDRYVQRLRIYPHALREANAYYSPQKRALLFGYFPGADDDTGRHYPGGMVFSCLSHDIVAHETTHALLDGMHPYFNEPSNVDVWAFHEAFADVMALFQHFTYPEVVRHQIANTRGDLETNNMLAQLAQQFGEATGQRGSLRDALGKVNKDGEWERTRPNPRALHTITEPHQRGSILIAAVFDAFLSLYNDRVADLLRISTGGTGILPAGQIHPDLVNRLAREAASAAEEVLRICIRAMDYVPPVDITFGEFLRALITADWELSELSPSERRRNRIAFIDAFRSWGIYPRDVASLSEESLRWRGPQEGQISLLAKIRSMSDRHRRSLSGLVRALEEWQPGSDRAVIFQHVLNAQVALHDLLVALQAECPPGQAVIPGLDLTRSFNVANLRPARRIGLRGQFRTEMVVEVVQTHRPPPDSGDTGGPYRGGATLIVDLRSWAIRYMIYKRLWEELPQPARDGQPAKPGVLAQRFSRTGQQQAATPQAAWSGEAAGSLSRWLEETYACRDRLANRRKKREQEEPFALLHRDHE